MAVIGFTAKLELDPGTTTYATVAETTSISFPSRDTTVHDASYLGQSGTYRLIAPGLSDGGTVDFECLYKKATMVTLNGVYGRLQITTVIPPSGGGIMWEITAPDEDAGGVGTAQTVTFAGILVKCDTSMDNDNVMKIKGSIKVHGEPTFGSAS